jgi:ribosome-associated toxin RatA of RatAB toxin-antitoxin module
MGRGLQCAQPSHSMKTVKKSVLIWYSATQMFDLVTHVAAYPQFLPWCDHAKVVQATPDGALAEVGISFSGIKQCFSTQNTHSISPEGVRSVGMQLRDGPFSQLDGAWHFRPLGAAKAKDAPSACKVELELRYGFDNAALGALVGPVFDKIASSLVDAFVKRAEVVYG